MHHHQQQQQIIIIIWLTCVVMMIIIWLTRVVAGQVGWSSTADFTDQWVYNEAAETYALDAEMAEKLQASNPEAFRNIVKRMLEANGRGYWQTDDDVSVRK
jgi:cobalamin biosynthesis Mg chelatase CobN